MWSSQAVHQNQGRGNKSLQRENPGPRQDKARAGSLQQLGVKAEGKSASTGEPWLKLLSSDMQSLRNGLIISKCSQFTKLTMLYHHPKMSTCVVYFQSLIPSCYFFLNWHCLLWTLFKIYVLFSPASLLSPIFWRLAHVMMLGLCPFFMVR